MHIKVLLRLVGMSNSASNSVTNGFSLVVHYRNTTYKSLRLYFKCLPLMDYTHIELSYVIEL